MSRFSLAKLTFAGVAILRGALPALAASETGSAAASVPLQRVSLVCVGITSIPMTADAEQALPMRVVARLGCGESVGILADGEGYTAHIRRDDGKEGFVARIYLNINDFGVAPADEPQPATASPESSIVRWRFGAPGCDEFATKGYIVESATANGITVQVSLQDSGWKLRTTVAVSNQGDDTIEIDPAVIMLDELQPELKSLQVEDPAKLSRVVNHQVLRTQANAQPPASARSSQAHLSNASYRPSAPNFFIERSVPAVSDGHETSAISGNELASLALKHTKLQIGEKTTGVLWFQRDGEARQLSLRVPVGELVFDFPLSFSQKK